MRDQIDVARLSDVHLGISLGAEENECFLNVTVQDECLYSEAD